MDAQSLPDLLLTFGSIIYLASFVKMLIIMERKNQRGLMIASAVTMFCGGTLIAYFWGWFKSSNKTLMIIWTATIILIFIAFIMKETTA